MLPVELEIDEITCQIDNGFGNGTDCNTYSRYITEPRDCIVDLIFNYTFSNVGLACVDVANIRSKLGPYNSVTVRFNDVYSYQERDICSNETWSIPHRRPYFDICQIVEDSWDIVIDIDDIDGGTTNLTSTYQWTFTPSMAPSTSILPSLSPSIFPSSLPSLVPSSEQSAAPSIDTCKDCTLTGIVHCESALIFNLDTFSF